MYDIRQAVDAAQQGRVLHPLVLGAAATTLGAAARMKCRLQLEGSAQQQQQEQQAGGGQFPALRALGAGIGSALPQLRQAIEQCIKVGAWAGGGGPAGAQGHSLQAAALPPPCSPMACHCRTSPAVRTPPHGLFWGHLVGPKGTTRLQGFQASSRAAT